MTKIGNSAFVACRSLKSITIPNSVTEIGINALAYCHYNLTIFAEEGFYAAQYAEENNISLELIESSTEITLSSAFDTFTSTDADEAITITGLDEGADVSLNPLEIPTQLSGVAVKAIGADAFRGNDKLLGVKIASAIEVINANAFADCGMLTSVDISETVKTIDAGAFANIGTKATGIASGSAVDTTDSASSSALVEVTIRGTDVDIDDTAFSGNPNILFKVKKGSAVEAFLKKKNCKVGYLPE